jgi:hypothetical protein
VAKHVMVVLTDAVEGREDEYNRWYDETHLADVIGVPGITAAQRFKVSTDQLPADITPPSEHRYLAIYELDGTPADVINGLNEGLAAGTIPLSEALDVPNVNAWLFTACTDRLTEADRTAGRSA